MKLILILTVLITLYSDLIADNKILLPKKANLTSTYPKKVTYDMVSIPEFVENTTGTIETNHPTKEISGVY